MLIYNKAKTKNTFKKSIPERLFLLHSLPFEGMDILAGLMENLLKLCCQEGYKDANMVYQATKSLHQSI